MRKEIAQNPIFNEEEAKLVENLDFDIKNFPDWLDMRITAEELNLNIDYTSFEYKLKRAINEYIKENKLFVKEVKDYLDKSKRRFTHLKRKINKLKLSNREKRILEECRLIIHYIENYILKKAENPETFDYEEFFIEKRDFEGYITILKEELLKEI